MFAPIRIFVAEREHNDRSVQSATAASIQSTRTDITPDIRNPCDGMAPNERVDSVYNIDSE